MNKEQNVEPTSVAPAGSNAPVGRSASIEIRRWDVIDIYFNEKDSEKIEALVEEYLSKGWEDPQWDEGGKKFDSCVQLQRHQKIKRRRVK